MDLLASISISILQQHQVFVYPSYKSIIILLLVSGCWINNAINDKFSSSSGCIVLISIKPRVGWGVSRKFSDDFIMKDM